MQFLEQIRLRFHRSFLKKELVTQKSKRSTMYLDSANFIGILFDGTEPAEREIVLAYAEQLKETGKKVKLLAFFDNKLKGESFAFPAFNRLQLDWALRPTSREALEFKDQPFDLLLNISKNSVTPLDYLAALSKARFRVGPYTDQTFCYDLLIEHAGKMDLKTFHQQVIFYMKKMRPNHEAAAA